MKLGTSGNLMIEVLREQKSKNGKVRRTSLGVMPAVPFGGSGRVVIVERGQSLLSTYLPIADHSEAVRTT